MFVNLDLNSNLNWILELQAHRRAPKVELRYAIQGYRHTCMYTFRVRLTLAHAVIKDGIIAVVVSQKLASSQPCVNAETIT